MLHIMDTGIGFPCPFRNVMIDYFSPTPFIYNEKPNFNIVLFVQSTTPWHRFLWIRHPMSWIMIIYFARNNGTKMLSHHKGWDTLGWDNIFFPLDTDLYPKFALLGKCFLLLETDLYLKFTCLWKCCLIPMCHTLRGETTFLHRHFAPRILWRHEVTKSMTLP